MQSIVKRDVANRGRTIGVVEDDADMRFLCAEVLRASGFAVVEWATLSAAFAALEHGIPDALVLDRELPDGSGLDLARWLRRRRSFDAVRIIGFSGRKSPQEIEEALRAGCDAFVAKPCAPAVLVAKIEALLATSRAPASHTAKRRTREVA
jgi:DNA-binding response OmpR family regulator